MFSLFKKNIENKSNSKHLSLISVAALLVHSAKIDENFTDKERNIIKNALIEMGADQKELDLILKDAELKEKDSNQILQFTKEVKNKSNEEKTSFLIILTLSHVLTLMFFNQKFD